MAEFTVNYHLKKPAPEDFYNIADFNENADLIDAALAQKADKATTIKRQLVIPGSGWTMGAEGMYYVDIPQADITAEMVPMVSVLPEDLAVAVACGLYPVSRTMSGGLRLYAAAAPVSAIQASLVLFLAGNGEAGGGSTGGGTYVLPVATATRLGGVKIGENVNVTQDGTISVLGDALLEDVAASDEDVQEMLDEAFNGSDPGANN